MSMDLSTDLVTAVKEKLDARAKRIGIPSSAVLLDAPVNSLRAALFICEQKNGMDVSRTAIMHFEILGEDTVCISVRETVLSKAGPPKDAVNESDADGWHSFRYVNVSEDTLKRISLYAADVLQYEFEDYETDAEPFECCSRNYTCSIRGECLHPDQMYAKACLFRRTLPNA